MTARAPVVSLAIIQAMGCWRCRMGGLKAGARWTASYLANGRLSQKHELHAAAWLRGVCRG